MAGTLATAVFLGLAVTAWAGTGPSLIGSTTDQVVLSGVTSVAVSGNYAYTTGYYDGVLTAIDISNPAQPVIAGSSVPTTTLLNGSTVNIAGGYAYVASKNRNGPSGSGSNDDGSGNALTILDIHTNPAHPAVVGSIHDSTNLFGAYGIALSGNYAFVAAQGCLSGQPCPVSTVGDAFDVVDVSNPSSPTIVATIHNSSLPAPWTGTNALKHICAVAISGNYAYVTAFNSNRLTVIDISNPVAPRVVASLQDSTRLNAPSDVVVSGGYAYVTDQGNSTGRLAVVNVQDPLHPQIVGLVDSTHTTLNGAYRVRLRNGIVSVAGKNASAVSAVDVSNPAAPLVAGTVTDAAHLNQTTGLDYDSTGRYLIANSYKLSTDPAQPLYPPFPLQPGGPTFTGTISVIDLDPVTNTVTIAPASEPPNPTSQSTANFTFTTADSVATQACQLDAGGFGLCTTPTSMSYTGLSAGSHTFVVHSTDAAGNVASDSYTWTISSAPPVNTSPPTIAGSASQGARLQAGPGNWTGSPAPTLTYQWERCDSGGANCAPIGGATASTYYAAAADIGSTLAVQVTGTNTAGSAVATSSATAVVVANALAPSTPILDDFNRADGPAGANWAVIRSNFVTMNVSSNAAVDSSTTTFAFNYWKPATYGPDAEAYATIAAWGGSAENLRIGARVINPGTNSDSGYFVQVSGTGVWSIIRIDSGVSTTLATGPTQVPAEGDGVAIRIVGSVVTALHETSSSGWAQVLSYDTSSDATRYTAAGSLAVGMKPSTIDDFGGGTVAAASPPVNTSPPTVSGSAVQGQTLTGGNGSWTGNPAPTLTDQWLRCDSGGANCAAIAAATSMTYVLAAADVGSTIRFQVTGTNTAGNAVASSAQTAVVTGPNVGPTTPVLDNFNRANGPVGSNWAVLRPTGYATMNVSGNAAVDSSTTTVASNYWKPSTFGPDVEAYATITTWGGSGESFRVGARIVNPGTTNASGYFAQISGTGVWSIIRVDAGPSTTLATGPTLVPSTGDGVAIRVVGSVVTVLHSSGGVWSQVMSYDTVSDATRYTAAGSIAVSFKPSTIDDFGGGTLGGATAPANTSPPTISGSATQGQTLTGGNGSWTGNPPPTLTDQWQRCDSGGANCVAIGGAVGTTYVLTAGDVGATIRLQVTGTNTAGSAVATSNQTAVVTASGSAPTNISPPTVSGTAMQGATLQGANGTWNGSPAPTLTEQWQRCDSAGANCAAIASATSLTYTLKLADVGSTIRLAETATNTSGSATVSSAASAVVAASIAPLTPVLDDFNRADGPVGSNWSLFRASGFAAMNVSGNAAVDSSGSSYAWNYWNAASFGPDCEAYVTVANAASGDTIRIGARVINAGTTNASGYFVQISGTGVWTILRVDAGPTTTLATGPTQLLSSGDKIGIRIVGSVVSAFRWTSGGGWSQVMSYDTSSDGTKYTTAGQVAVEFKTSTVDDFGGGTLA
jgi:hypothetical protein